jgi:hypothetical protein
VRLGGRLALPFFAFQPKPDPTTGPEFISRPKDFISGKSFVPDLPVRSNPVRPVRLLSALHIMACGEPTTDRLFDVDFIGAIEPSPDTFSGAKGPDALQVIMAIGDGLSQTGLIVCSNRRRDR